jgi:release factor glutamine methyltransferase
VRDYEPAEALFAGEDGLDVIRQLVDASTGGLKRGAGWLILEFGAGQEAAVRELLSIGRCFEDIEFIPDLQGIPRTAVARRTGGP